MLLWSPAAWVSVLLFSWPSHLPCCLSCCSCGQVTLPGCLSYRSSGQLTCMCVYPCCSCAQVIYMGVYHIVLVLKSPTWVSALLFLWLGHLHECLPLGCSCAQVTSPCVCPSILVAMSLACVYALLFLCSCHLLGCLSYCSCANVAYLGVCTIAPCAHLVLLRFSCFLSDSLSPLSPSHSHAHEARVGPSLRTCPTKRWRASMRWCPRDFFRS